MAFVAGVTFGPLVVNSHAQNGYLTTPIQFGSFPPVVRSPFFLRIILITAKVTTTKAPKAKAVMAKKHAINMYTINCTRNPIQGQKHI